MPMVELNYTLEEYMTEWGNLYDNGELWDFSKDDFEGGAVEINENQVYWFINGRYYETYKFEEGECL